MARKSKRSQERGKDERNKTISAEVTKATPAEPHAPPKPFDDPWHSTADLIVVGLFLCGLAALALATGWCAGVLTARYLFPLFE